MGIDIITKQMCKMNDVGLLTFCASYCLTSYTNLGFSDKAIVKLLKEANKKVI